MTHEQLEHRLLHLERHNRWLRRGFIFVILGGLSLLLMGQSNSVLTARAFRLVEGGKVHAELALIGSSEPSLLLRDKAGRNRIAATVQKGIPKLVLYDAKAKPRFMVTTQKGGSPAAVLYDAAGRGRTTIALRLDGSPIVVFTKADGSVQRSLP